MASLLGMFKSQKARAWAFADLLIALLVLLAGARLALHGAAANDPPRRPQPLLQPGQFFSVPNSSAQNSATTVVLFALKDCFATVESVEFYKRLMPRIAAVPGATLIVLSQDAPDAMRSWLSANELRVEHVAHVPDPAAVGLLLSPTVIVLNQVGVADTVLAGRLQPTEEAALFERVGGKQTQAPIGNVPNEIDERDLPALQDKGGIQVVDISERAQYRRFHRGGSLNIPDVELPVRARIELDVRQPLILECPPQAAPACPAAGTFLRQKGFERVSLVYSGFKVK